MVIVSAEDKYIFGSATDNPEVKEREEKKNYYHHHDGYETGVGLELVDILRKAVDEDAFNYFSTMGIADLEKQYIPRHYENADWEPDGQGDLEYVYEVRIKGLLKGHTDIFYEKLLERFNEEKAYQITVVRYSKEDKRMEEPKTYKDWGEKIIFDANTITGIKTINIQNP